MSQSATITYSYSTADVENVVKNFAADLRMIAESTGTWDRAGVDKHVADVNYLAKKGYLKFVDLTLLSNGTEARAVRYMVNENSGELVASRPGGVLWPRVASPRLRIILQPTAKWTKEPPDAGQLNYTWSDSTEDLSHSGLKENGGRNFTSNAYGFERKDYSA